MWTDSRYLAQADAELDCEWHIFDIGQNIGIADWLDVSASRKSSKKKINPIQIHSQSFHQTQE